MKISRAITMHSGFPMESAPQYSGSCTTPGSYLRAEIRTEGGTTFTNPCAVYR